MASASWPPNGPRKVIVGVVVLLIASGIAGAVLTYSQSLSNGEQLHEVRQRQDRHEVRGHRSTAEEVADTRETVAELKGEVGAIKAKVDDLKTDSRETRDNVEWIRRRMGGGGR